MKLSKLLFPLLVICSLICTMYLQSTYAKYKDKIDGTTNIQIANWNIKVNNESILNKNSLTSNIEAVFPGSEYVNPNVLAPGVEGYYDITIDSTSVDVAFEYYVEVNKPAENTIIDLVVTGYEINPTATPNPTIYTDNISGSLLLSEQTETIRVYVKWDDSQSASMDNIADTEAVTNENAKALLTNTITFVQMNN